MYMYMIGSSSLKYMYAHVCPYVREHTCVHVKLCTLFLRNCEQRELKHIHALITIFLAGEKTIIIR